MKEIPLTQGKVALVDNEDYERLSQFSWYAYTKPLRGWWYARRTAVHDGKRVTVLMHRYVLGFNPGDPAIDHQDLDGLNNQKDNLRVATRAQNAANTPPRRDNKSGVKGISFRVRGRYAKWEATITTNRKTIWLGAFATAEEAAAAYAKAALKYHGEFARF